MRIGSSEIVLAVLLFSTSAFGQAVRTTAPPPAKVTAPGPQRQQPPARQPVSPIAKAPAPIPAPAGGIINGYVYWAANAIAHQPPSSCTGLAITVGVGSSNGPFQAYQPLGALSNNFKYVGQVKAYPVGGKIIVYDVCAYGYNHVPVGPNLQVKLTVTQPTAFTPVATPQFSVVSPVKIVNGQCNMLPKAVPSTLSDLTAHWGSCQNMAYDVNFVLLYPMPTLKPVTQPIPGAGGRSGLPSGNSGSHPGMLSTAPSRGMLSSTPPQGMLSGTPSPAMVAPGPAPHQAPGGRQPASQTPNPQITAAPPLGMSRASKFPPPPGAPSVNTKPPSPMHAQVAAPLPSSTAFNMDKQHARTPSNVNQTMGPFRAIPYAQNSLAPPTNLMYTNDPTVCKAHVPGLGAALICPGLMASAVVLPLVWDWQPCKDANCVTKPDGYRIYKVTNSFANSRTIHSGEPKLVDTQPDPTISIRGISPFAKTDCYVVTAFKGSKESADSNEWCGAPNLAMGIATVRIYPTVMETRWEVIPTACSPNQTISVNKGPLEEGVSLASRNRMGGVTECWATVVYHGYAGFNINARGRIRKALFNAPNFAGNCNIKGVVKTVNTSWFAKYSMTPVHLGQTPAITYVATDHTSEREFDLNSELIPVGAEKEMYHSATADITSWFPSGGLPALGIGFVKTKYYNPSDVSQPTDNTAEQIARDALCASNPICPWYVYLSGGTVNTNNTHTNPPDEFTPCVFDFGWVWLDIEYYPSS